MAALGDPGFAATPGRGRSLRLATVDRVLAFMGEPPAGAAFRVEVEAFLEAIGMKRSAFGLAAAGNPSFVAQLRRGEIEAASGRDDLALRCGGRSVDAVCGRAGRRGLSAGRHRSRPPGRDDVHGPGLFERLADGALPSTPGVASAVRAVPPGVSPRPLLTAFFGGAPRPMAAEPAQRSSRVMPVRSIPGSRPHARSATAFAEPQAIVQPR